MIHALWNILLLGVAVFLVAELLPGIRLKNFGTAIIVAIVYSLINYLIGWLLVLLSLPFIIITFGLFKIVINALLLLITDKVIDDFEIDGIGITFMAALLISIVDSILRWIF
ncbi:phage holin family protein [Thermodesulfobacteriota bacterium]